MKEHPAYFSRPRQRDGFSLIELLVVIAIIALLTAIVIGVASAVKDNATEARAKAELAHLMEELDKYQQKNHVYPVNVADNGSTSIDESRAIPAGFVTWWTNANNGANWTVTELDVATGVPIDPWGQAYIYIYTPTINPNVYVLGTKGRDSAFGEYGSDTNNITSFGSGDDISNKNGRLSN